ncbi:MAG: DUF2179 domain-containing protein [Chloroflexota bacterium]
MFWSILGSALLIFFLRLTDVSMGTVRTMMIMRGQRKWAALIGFVEVTIWVLAISQVIQNLDSIWNIFGYSGGFATGTLLGMAIENRLALGYSTISVISMSQGLKLAEEARSAGFGATMVEGTGKSGPVYLINIVVQRKQVAQVMELVNSIDATAFVTVEEPKTVRRGYRRIAK